MIGMELLDGICDPSRASELLGLSTDRKEARDEEEIYFEDDDTLFSASLSQTYTGTYTNTNDGTGTYTGTYTYDGTGTSTTETYRTNGLTRGSSGPLMNLSQSAFQKTTPLFDAIDQRYWSTVMHFLSTGQWDKGGRSRLPAVPLKEEARQWSVTLDKSGKVTSRRLPIHAALLNRAPLNVVDKLIELYPNGASCADSQGNLPLHLAFQKEASSDVITYLLDAYPEAVLVKNNAKRARAKKGFLPMECTSSRSKEAKAMIKLCQDRARDLSYNNIATGFDLASSASPRDGNTSVSDVASSAAPKGSKIMRNLSFKPSSERSTTPKDNDAQEDDLMEIQRELDDLRRVGSGGGVNASASSGDPDNQIITKEDSLDLDSWMRSLGNFHGGFLAGALSSKPDDEEGEGGIHLPAIVEAASSASEHVDQASSVFRATKPVKSPSSLGRWINGMPSLSQEDADDRTKESFEVNLTTQSVGTASQSSKKSKPKKRFSFSNPFRKSNGNQKQKEGMEQIDTVTVQSGSSKANLSVSRFSLSAVKDGTSTKPTEATSTGGTTIGSKASSRSWAFASDRSSAASKMSRSARSKSSTSTKGIFSKGPKSWLKRNAGSGQAKKQAQTTQDQSEANISTESLVFAQEEAKALDAGPQGGVLSPWNTEKNSLTRSMTNMMLSNATAANANQVQQQQDHHQDEFESQEFSEPMASAPQEAATGIPRSNRSLGGSFLKMAENSFLENSLLMSSQLAGTLKPEEITPETGRTQNSVDESDTESSSSRSRSSGMSDNDSTTSREESITSSEGRDTAKGQDDPLQETRSSKCTKRGGPAFLPDDKRTAPEASTSTPEGNFVRRFGKRGKRRKKQRRARNASASQISSSSDENKKKSKFGLFRRRKSSENLNTPSDAENAQASKNNDHAAIFTKQLQQKAADAQRRANLARKAISPLSAEGTSVARYNRQGSISSRSRHSDGTEGKKPLPIRADWRAEYEDYFSATQSGTPAEKKSVSGSASSSQAPQKQDAEKELKRQEPGHPKEWHKESKLEQSSLDRKRLSTKGHCAEDILQDLESVSQYDRPFILDSAAASPQQRTQYTMDPAKDIAKDSRDKDAGPVVSESTVETNGNGNVYLVRVQF